MIKRWTTLLVAVALLAVFTGCGGYGGGYGAKEAGFDFSAIGAYQISGGDTEGAGLSGFERDSFHNFFVKAANTEMQKRKLEFSAEAPDALLRYTLREKLIVTLLDVETRRLIWRGESSALYSDKELSQDWVTELVKQAMASLPVG